MNRLLLACIFCALLPACGSEDVSDLHETIFVRHQGADMPAYVHGNGSEGVFLIVLHGGPGGNGLIYRSGIFTGRLEEEMAVVYFDQRGSGMAQGRYDLEDLTPEVMAEDVMALTQVLRSKYGDDSRFFLMGHSWGGMLGSAVLTTGDNQASFRGWIEVDGAHDVPALYFNGIDFLERTAREQLSLGNSNDHWDDVLSDLDDIDRSGYNRSDAGKLNRLAFASESVLLDDEVLESPKPSTALQSIGRTAFGNNPLTGTWNLINTNLSIVNQDYWQSLSYTDRLSDVTIPSLLLWGSHDLVVPPSLGRIALDALGSQEKELILFDRSGHSPMMNEEELFGVVISAFVERFK